MTNGQRRLAIVTVVLEPTEQLLLLAKDLENQFDKNFTWYLQVSMCRSAASKTILDTVLSMKLNISCVVEFDNGIYDALNKSISRIKEEYYIVFGDDDRANDMLVSHWNLFENSYDIMSFSFICNDVFVRPFRGSFLLKGPYSVVAGHATSSVIRKDLHSRFGYYDTSYRIAADYKFFCMCIKGGAQIIGSNYVAGTFATEGLSRLNVASSGHESFRARSEVFGLSFLDHLIFATRRLKWLALEKIHQFS